MNTLNAIHSRFSPLFYMLMVLGALNYGLKGVANYDLFHHLFASGTVLTVIYILIGVAGVMGLDKAIESFSSKS